MPPRNEVESVVNHADVRARMADYLEGHLALADRALLDAHLDGCPDCANEIAEIRATIAAMRSLPEPEVPGDFAANVIRRIRIGDAEPGWLGRLALLFDALGSPRVLVPVSAAVLSVGLVLWGQQLGVLSTNHAPSVDRVALQASNGGSSAGASSTRTAQEDATPNSARLAGASSEGQGDIASSAGDVRFGGSGSRADLPHAIRFQIVMGDGNRPPYVLEASGSNSVAPIPWRMDQPASPGSSGFGSIDGHGGGAVAVSTAGIESSTFDGPMQSQAPALDSERGVRPSASGRAPRSRDDWLAILETNPADFSWRVSRLTLAERELWVDRLARHAQQQGVLDRVVSRLESAGGPDGRLLAEEFAGVAEDDSSSVPGGGAR